PHGQTGRLQRRCLEAKTGRRPPPQRRARGRSDPAGPQAVRRRLAADAPARVVRSPLWTLISSLGRSSELEGCWASRGRFRLYSSLRSCTCYYYSSSFSSSCDSLVVSYSL